MNALRELLLKICFIQYRKGISGMLSSNIEMSSGKIQILEKHLYGMCRFCFFPRSLIKLHKLDWLTTISIPLWKKYFP